jgi:hypothetical protein
MTSKQADPVRVPGAVTELGFGNAILYLVAEYAHVELGIPRRLSVEKYLRSLLGAETGLYLTEEFYRDHTFHMVYVCLSTRAEDSAYIIELLRRQIRSCRLTQFPT